jgi:hypothetical protein
MGKRNAFLNPRAESRVSSNIKRGFNRLFIVATIVWALYCAVWLPLKQQGEALTQADKTLQLETKTCMDSAMETARESGSTESVMTPTAIASFNACSKIAKDEWEYRISHSSVKTFYATQWPFILAGIVIVPLIAYGIMRGVVAVSMWIWRGYKQA